MTANYEPSKRNPFKTRMTGAGRAKKSREVKKKASKELKGALGIAGDISNPKLLEIAAARLSGVGAGNPVLDFEFATSAYLTKLTRMCGNCIPVESYWSQFIDLVKEADSALAITFAKDFKSQFQWCLSGHVQRLKMEHNQLPDSIKNILILEKRGKRSFAAEHHDGTIITMPEEGFRRLDPCIIFAGTEERPPVNTTDIERLIKLPCNNRAELVESGKFKLTLPKRELFTSDTVLNVSKPFDLENIRMYLSIFGFKPRKKK